eukprot:s56_g33.t1
MLVSSLAATGTAAFWYSHACHIVGQQPKDKRTNEAFEGTFERFEGTFEGFEAALRYLRSLRRFLCALAAIWAMQGDIQEQKKWPRQQLLVPATLGEEIILDILMLGLHTLSMRAIQERSTVVMLVQEIEAIGYQALVGTQTLSFAIEEEVLNCTTGLIVEFAQELLQRPRAEVIAMRIAFYPSKRELKYNLSANESIRQVMNQREVTPEAFVLEIHEREDVIPNVT